MGTIEIILLIYFISLILISILTNMGSFKDGAFEGLKNHYEEKGESYSDEVLVRMLNIYFKIFIFTPIVNTLMGIYFIGMFILSLFKIIK